jgi:hypothetical protein
MIELNIQLLTKEHRISLQTLHIQIWNQFIQTLLHLQNSPGRERFTLPSFIGFFKWIILSSVMTLEIQVGERIEWFSSGGVGKWLCWSQK